MCMEECSVYIMFPLLALFHLHACMYIEHACAAQSISCCFDRSVWSSQWYHILLMHNYNLSSKYERFAGDDMCMKECSVYKCCYSIPKGISYTSHEK